MEKKEKKPLVFLVCTGLGRINRGYESFSRECFNVLQHNSQIELVLVKGGGENYKNEVRLPNLHRNHKATLYLGKALKLQPYVIEQITFCISLFCLIIKRSPSVIYYSDFILGTYLWHLRKHFKFRYKLLFANGAPNGPPYKTEDHVQQLLPVYYDQAIKAGTPVSKLTLLPYGFDINILERISNSYIRNDVRGGLHFFANQKVILSVGAINKHHKRMDYIIKEVSKLPSEYFLVILGQFEEETNNIIELASNVIPSRYLISNVPFEEVRKYYIAADFFVLASYSEGFGRVLIEAQSYGLPCIVNDNINAREVLKEHGSYINMEVAGELACFLLKEKKELPKETLIEASYNTYSWDKLKGRYVDMILKLVIP